MCCNGCHPYIPAPIYRSSLQAANQEAESACTLPGLTLSVSRMGGMVDWCQARCMHMASLVLPSLHKDTETAVVAKWKECVWEIFRKSFTELFAELVASK